MSKARLEAFAVKHSTFLHTDKRGNNPKFQCNFRPCQWTGTKQRVPEHLAGQDLPGRQASKCLGDVPDEVRAEACELEDERLSKKGAEESQKKTEQAAFVATGTKLSAQRTILQFASRTKDDKATEAIMQFFAEESIPPSKARGEIYRDMVQVRQQRHQRLLVTARGSGMGSDVTPLLAAKGVLTGC
jgi:hypothetical protein